MTLYQIVKSLQQAKGSLEKQAILNAHKDNELFKAYMKAVYDVGINYYMKKIPAVSAAGIADLDQELLDHIIKVIAGRRLTGSVAASMMKATKAVLTPEGQELLTYVFDRSIGAGVGDTMILRTWPDLYFLPPYQRCSLLDAKARERFGKLDKFVVQTKLDGSFAYLVCRKDGLLELITRQGNKYPADFPELVVRGGKDIPVGTVLVGELMMGYWKADGTGLPVDEAHYQEQFSSATYEPYDRKTSNGLLNSVLKGGELDISQEPSLIAWDMLTEDEFVAGASSRPYAERFNALKDHLEYDCGGITVADTWEVSSLEEAFAIYQQHLQRGLEGCIIKDPASLWKDGTSKEMVKLKLKFEVEMKVTGVYEGEGKAAGMLGGVYIESEDGGIQCACGSGFNDEQRKHFWKRETIIGAVVVVEANDITQSRDERKKPSLSLPIFCEVRYDKQVADTTERIYAQLEAAKNGA